MKRARARSGSDRGAPQRHAPARAGLLARPAVGAAVIVALAMVGYSNTLRGAFVFDDIPVIRDNPLLRDVAAYLPGGAGAQASNRWVAYLTFALNHALGGLDPAGYHVANLAIHCATALLVLAFATLSFRTPVLSRSRLAPRAGAVAFAAAVLFATHPIQTQAVTYVVQRMTSLAALFYVATVVLYLRWRIAETPPRPARSRAVLYALLLGTAYLSLRTKEIAFTLPFVLALCELAFFDPAGWRRFAPIVPVFALALVIPMTLVGGALRSPAEAARVLGAATRVQTETSRWDYLLTEIPVVAKYLRLLVVPVGQNIDHDRPILHSMLAPEVLGALAVLLVLVATAIVLWWRTSARAARPIDPAARLVAFGVAWFFVTLSVESSLIPIMDPIFEHRVYLPSAGFFVALAAGGSLLVTRPGSTRPLLRLELVAAALAIVLAGATFARNRVWADPMALWSDAAAKSPLLTRPHSNVGLLLADSGRTEEAAEQFRIVVALRPDHVDGHNNLAVALRNLGRTDEAARVLQTALRLDPGHAETWFNLGQLDLAIERYDAAAEAFAKAISLQPRYPAAYANLAAALNRQRHYEDTVALLETARDQLRDSAEAHFNLGIAHAALGDVATARREAAILRELSADLAAKLDAFVQARASAQP